jgi:hypothetical protein
MRKLPVALFLMVLLASCSKPNSSTPIPPAVAKSAPTVVPEVALVAPVPNPQGVVGVWSVGAGDDGSNLLIAQNGKGFGFGMAGGYKPLTWTYDPDTKILRVQILDQTSGQTRGASNAEITLPFDPNQDGLGAGGTAKRVYKRAPLGADKSMQQIYDEWYGRFQQQQTFQQQQASARK